MINNKSEIIKQVDKVYNSLSDLIKLIEQLEGEEEQVMLNLLNEIGFEDFQELLFKFRMLTEMNL